jgi:hypothetical protein
MHVSAGRGKDAGFRRSHQGFRVNVPIQDSPKKLSKSDSIAARASGESSPSAVRIRQLSYVAPSEMTPMMDFPFTRTFPFSIVMNDEKLFASLTIDNAGRVCIPALFLTTIFLEQIMFTSFWVSGEFITATVPKNND